MPSGAFGKTVDCWPGTNVVPLMVLLAQTEFGIVAQAEIERELAGDAEIILHVEREQIVDGVQMSGIEVCRQDAMSPSRNSA